MFLSFKTILNKTTKPNMYTTTSLQEVLSYLQSFSVECLSSPEFTNGKYPFFDVQSWFKIMSVIDKLPIQMRMKSRNKIIDILQQLKQPKYSLDTWRHAYKLWHAIGNWFVKAHNDPPLYTYNSEQIKVLIDHFDKDETKNLPVIITMTSCKRFDLLSRTINSMIANCTDITKYVREWIVIDDNSDDNDKTMMKQLYPFISYIFKNKEQKGHPRSMNMLHDHLTNSNALYNFHIEDDFEWWYPDTFIEKTIQILEKESNYGQALLNFEYTEDQLSAIDIWNRDMFYVDSFDSNIRYFVHEYYNTRERINSELNLLGARCSMYWPHFSFRPGMTKIDVFRTVGKYNEVAKHFEMEYAERYVKHGYKTTTLDCAYTTHIGRRTYERDTNKLNAYDLNNEQQFGTQPKQTKITNDGPKTPPVMINNQQQNQNISASDLTNIRLYVINLERRPERLLKFFKHNNQECPPFEVFKAIDGKNLKPSLKIQKIFETGDYNFRRGIVGCAYSHLQIWSKFMKSNAEYCVILEDDVILAPKFNEKLLHLLTTYGQSFELMFLHWNPYPDIQNRINHLFDHEGEKPTIVDYELKTVLPTATEWCVSKSIKLNMGSGAGYILTRKGAKHMLDWVNINGMPNAVDWVLMKQTNMRIMYSKPKLVFADCWQNNQTVQSDIQLDYDCVKYENDFDYLIDELYFWTKELNKGIFLHSYLSLSENEKQRLSKISNTNLSSARVILDLDRKLSYTGDIINDSVIVCSKNKIYDINEICSKNNVKWYIIGGSYVVIVPDIFISTKIYNMKVWDVNRINFNDV